MHAFEPRDVTLRDGRTVHLRAVLPTDEEEILQAFDRMGPQSRYMRFMSPVKDANVQRLRTVLASFPEKGMAIAATVTAPDGIDIVGTASFFDLGGASCEFAIAIPDEWGGKGLGRALMTALIGEARARGLEKMHGFVLAQNGAMLGLAKRMGFAAAADPDDFSIRVVSLAL